MTHVDPSAASDSDAACERSEILARKQSALSRYCCNVCGTRYSVDNSYFCIECGTSYCVRCVEALEVISGAGTISMRRRCGCGGGVV